LSLRAVARGQTYLSPAVSGFIIADYRKQKGQTSGAASDLTIRQREILGMIAQGMTTKAIAKNLRISAKTVDWHRTHLMERLDIHDVAGLVRYAMRIGLVAPES
jgi:DNA-binding NarL/FixJ family response regulator